MHFFNKVLATCHQIYAQCEMAYDNFVSEKESKEYAAHTFVLSGKKGLFRIAKKTPKKSGSFVTIWKRDTRNKIIPYSHEDDIDFVVVVVTSDTKVGQFIFSKDALLEKGIVSTAVKQGKLAMRVYAPWDVVTSLQAARTQKWQSEFWVDLDNYNLEVCAKIKKLYLVD